MRSLSRTTAARRAPTALVVGVAALLASAGCGQAGPPQGLLAVPHPSISPSDPDRLHFHSFGRVPYGDQVSHTFRFENTDPVPVTIVQVQSSCGCSVAQLRRVDAGGRVLEQGDSARAGALLTVPPGSLCEIEMRIDSRAVPQADVDKLVTVRVATDSVQRPWITLEAHVIVDLGFVHVPRVLELTRVAQGAGANGEVLIRKDGDLGLVLTGVEDAPPGFDVELVEDSRSPGNQWKLRVELPPGRAPGATQGAVRLATRYPDGRVGRPFQVPVFARVVADIGVQPTQVLLRSRGDDAPVAQELRVSSLIQGLRFRIESWDAEGAGSDAIQVELIPESPDARSRASAWTVRVSLDRGALTGPAHGTLRLVLDDPQTPRLELPYVAVIQ